MTSTLAKLDELEHRVFEKDSVVKSTQLQLSDAKIKLADKQAALERLLWEAMTSSTQVEKLQENVNTMQAEMSSFTLLCEGLRKNDAALSTEDDDAALYHSDNLTDIDCLDEMEMQKMEKAQEAYIAIVATAKENQDEESIVVARSARLHLQSFVFKNYKHEHWKNSCYVTCPRPAGEKLFHQFLKASGHVDKFTDLMVKDEKTGTCYHADHLLKDFCEEKLERDLILTEEKSAELRHVLVVLDDLSSEELGTKIKEYGIAAPDTKYPLLPQLVSPDTMIFQLDVSYLNWSVWSKSWVYAT